MKRVLVAAVHPDDETLGAGGSLLKLKDGGAEIFWLIITGMSSASGFKDEQIKNRQIEISKTAADYGFSQTYALNFPTTSLDQKPLRDIAQEIGLAVKDCKPDTVFIPHKFDAHTDHTLSHKILSGLTKTFRYPSIENVFSMETISETNFSSYNSNELFFPNCYIDISPYLERKIEIMKNFGSEIQPHPFPRSEESMRALAILRGSEAGFRYAEAFYIMKQLVK